MRTAVTCLTWRPRSMPRTMLSVGAAVIEIASFRAQLDGPVIG
jgi:hypothetical protein